MNNILVLDFESTIRGNARDRPNPLHPSNFPVYLGVSHLDWRFNKVRYEVFKFYSVEEDRHEQSERFLQFMDDVYWGENTLLVGHNITFDILHLRRLYPIHRPRIFDTSVAHYLITGQKDRWPSLDHVIKYYGISTPKDESLKEMWAEGIDTTHINPDVLLPYLQNDVDTTEKIFRYQLTDLDRLGLLNVFKVSMASQVYTTEMSWNGMRIEKEQLRYHLSTYAGYLENTKDNFLHTTGLDLASPQQLSCYLFGGIRKETHIQNVVDEDGNPTYYKSGKKKGLPRTRKVDVPVHVPARYNPEQFGSVRGKSGSYSVDDGVLKNIAATGDPQVKKILEYRRRVKVYNSFLKTYEELLDGLSTDIIHPNINSTATYTGRLSSSKPNMQQVP